METLGKCPVVGNSTKGGVGVLLWEGVLWVGLEQVIRGPISLSMVHLYKAWFWTTQMDKM